MQISVYVVKYVPCLNIHNFHYHYKLKACHFCNHCFVYEGCSFCVCCLLIIWMSIKFLSNLVLEHQKKIMYTSKVQCIHMYQKYWQDISMQHNFVFYMCVFILCRADWVLSKFLYNTSIMTVLYKPVISLVVL